MSVQCYPEVVTPRQSSARTRRRVLAGVGTVAGIALAGCTDDSDTDVSGDPNGASDDSDPDGSDDDSGSDGTSDDSNPDDTSDGPGGSDDGPGCENGTVHEGYEETAVHVTTPDGEELGSVTAAIADTGETRRTGLSETECLPEDRGMLFVYDEVRDRTFWMIHMDFGIDIVYVDDEGPITSIHHADAPADGESGTEDHHQYPGEGRYVLEVNDGWTTERGIDVGDVVMFDR